jgi:uncharacterized membrane protein (DUF4010 family)
MITSPLMPETFLPGLALATAIGLLIGAERGWRTRDDKPGTRVAGIRTFAILGLLGGLVGATATLEIAMVSMLVAFGAIVAVLAGYFVEMRTEANLSATSAVATGVTMLLGALATSGEMALASVGAGIMVALLASREVLHKALGRTSQVEIKALVRLALVVFLILPLLPDAAVGPFGGINPRRIWFVVVAVGAVSFAGYVLVRWQGGRKGTLLMAFVGATVSSTAVTIEAARRLRGHGNGAIDNGAISIASFVMLVRVVILTSLVAPAVAGAIVSLLLPALIISLGFAGVQVWLAFDHRGDDHPDVKPPSLGLAIVFATLVAVLSFGARWAELKYGSGGGALVVALGGMVDVDSAIAAVGALPLGAVTTQLAAFAIAIAVAFNTLLKLGLVVSIGGVRNALRAGTSLAITVFAIAVSTGLALMR